jgi:hypothetical protein
MPAAVRAIAAGGALSVSASHTQSLKRSGSLWDFSIQTCFRDVTGVDRYPLNAFAPPRAGPDKEILRWFLLFPT